MSEATLTLTDGTIIEKGEKIYICSRSYTFVDKDGTSEYVDMSESGNYKFIDKVKDGILVSSLEYGGTIFIYTGPDRVLPSGTHIRSAEISKHKPKTIKPVKRKSKTEVVMTPSVVGSKQKDLAPLPKKRGRKPGSKNKVKTAKRGRGRPKKK
jgi:hypothetical protein